MAWDKGSAPGRVRFQISLLKNSSRFHELPEIIKFPISKCRPLLGTLRGILVPFPASIYEGDNLPGFGKSTEKMVYIFIIFFRDFQRLYSNNRTLQVGHEIANDEIRKAYFLSDLSTNCQSKIGS